MPMGMGSPDNRPRRFGWADNSYRVIWRSDSVRKPPQGGFFVARNHG